MTIELSALQRQRRDTAANWTAENPTLLAGEIGIESDTGKIKIGNGSTAWASLSYQGIIPSSGVYPLSQLLMPSGAVGAPSISFDGDTNLGIYRSGTDQLSFTTAGTERLRIDATGQIEAVSLGSAAAPTFSWTGDPNTGLYSPGADQVAISTNGTGRLFVDASGNVGVGQASPSNYNSVFQQVIGNTSSTNAGLVVGTSSAGSAWIGFNDAGDASIPGYIKYNHTSDSLEFQVNSNERMRLDSSGRLGLGTSSPTDTLNISSAANQIGLDTGNQAVYGTLDIGHFANGAFIGTQAGSDGASNLLRFGTGGTERLRLDSSGRLGLGTSSPQLPFTIGAGGGANPATSGSTQSAGGVARLGSAGVATLDVGFLASGPAWLQATNVTNLATNYSLLLNPNGGSVGIGSTGPQYPLHTETTGTGTAAGDNTAIFLQSQASGRDCNIRFGDSVNASARIGYLSNNLYFYVNANERARIDSSGRLLVGTSSWSGDGKLIVQANASNSAGEGSFGIVNGSAASSISSGSTIGNLDFMNNAGGLYARIAAQADAAGAVGDHPGRLVFSTTADGASSPTERMRITNGGLIDIGGLYSVGANAIRFDVQGSNFSRNTTGSATHIFFVNPNGGVGSITTSGSATAYNTSSDYRLKENVVPLTGAIDRLNDLQVHRFSFIADPDKTVDGFIAHEAQAVVPECVTGTKDEVDDEGNPVYQGIDQSKLVPLLTAALQEALVEIESLKARLDAAGI